MSNMATGTHADDVQTAARPPDRECGTRNEILAGVGFFVILGLAPILATWPRELLPIPPWLGVFEFLGAYLIIVAGFAVGWIKGFPRWSYPYAFYTIAFAYHWMGVATPGLKIFGYTFQHDELWGWRAWIPFAVVAVIALLATRSAQPFVRLGQRVRSDWTQLPFGLYGVLPLAVLFAFDEVNIRFQFPFMLLSAVILVAGALSYMRSASEGRRVLSLVGSTTLLILTAAVGTGVYWHGRYEAWMKEPANGYAVAFGAVVMGIVWLCLMLLPAFLRFFARKNPQPAG